MTQRTGRCQCGAVRFTAQTTSARFSVCHCKMCQRRSSGPFLAVSVPAAGVTLEGADHIRHMASSEFAERAWCDKCGSGLWYRMTTTGDEADYEISLGLFDDTSGFEIESEIFIDTKPEGYALSGQHPRMTEAEIRAARNAQEGDAK